MTTSAQTQLPASSSGDASLQWWRKPFGMFQTNLREINADMDVEKVLDFIQAHGADAWLIGTGGILSFYPTDLPFETRNPHLAKRASGDLIGDAIKAAHGRGVRLLARMDFSKTTARVAAEHPDWCFISPTGKLQTHTGDLVSVCPSGPYYQERVFEILDEVTTRYPVDGFFFNWFSFNEQDYNKVYQGVCHCANCHTKFKAFSGLELPDGPSGENYSAWLVFAADTINKITARIRAFIASKLPHAGLILGTTADIMFHEANNALGRELWHHATSEWVSASRAYRPNVPVLVNSVTFMDMPYRMASEEPDHFAQYFVQTLSRGGNPSTYIMGVPGQIPYPCLDIAGQIMRFHKKWRAVYDGMMPCAKTALVRPNRLEQTATQFAEATVEFKGLYLALQERHVPFDVVAQENITKTVDNGGLGRYAVIVLPDLGPLSEAILTTLDTFVSSGGRLLATGSSGLAADNTIQLKSLPAVKRTKAVTDKKQLWSSYVSPIMDKNGDPNVYPPPVVPLYGAYFYFDWKADAKHHLGMLAPAPFAPPEKAYGNVQVDEPGYVIGAYEKGRAAMIPWTVGRAYRDLGLTVVREMFYAVITDLLADDEPISAELPHQVEITVNKNGGKTVVHLVNMSGKGHSNFGTHVPIRGGLLRVAGAGEGVKARALVGDEACEVRYEKGAAVIVLPELGLFDVIVIG